MRLIGLTGGIASGKSTVSRHLESEGLPVVDADKVARVALDKNTWGWKRVVAAFGEGILRQDGEVDRAKLGEIIFNDPAKRGMLNRALQPCISLGLLYEVFKHWIRGTSVVIMDIPLLFEMKMNYLTNPVVVVWVDRTTQEARLTKRDNSTIEQARARIDSQLPLDMKREMADYVIDNSGTLEDTKMHVDKLKAIITGPQTWKEIALSRFGVAAIVAVAVAFVLRLR
ncbi:dephospho-CoA kinase [Physcomitrium patens]|uniref:Dephospho-CoA kinase n=1 Tax=Physcomitrium patens TaxID=3218 RepID=A9RUW0_PHYPA|nr:dephospho-CoA kinase-like [Physcomitrium patens]PNR59819.1 hypothetical protein PHYPA_002611 [Physcomitrium patens]|eukprot:XP_024360618.1 dephospho-CoA kinase-like [Physcomitrella patens]